MTLKYSNVQRQIHYFSKQDPEEQKRGSETLGVLWSKTGNRLHFVNSHKLIVNIIEIQQWSKPLFILYQLVHNPLF